MPAGDKISDGDQFTILDSDGKTVYFEFESGFRLQVRELEIHVPLAGSSFGGVADGDRFTINDRSRTVTFEFDTDFNSLPGNVRIPIGLNATRNEIAEAVFAAIHSTTLPVVAQLQSDGRIFLRTANAVTVNTTFSIGGVADGDRFAINDGVRTVVFEFDTDFHSPPDYVRIPIGLNATRNEIAEAAFAAFRSTLLAVGPQLQPDGRIFLRTYGVTVNTTFSALTQPSQTQAFKIPDLGHRPGGITDGQQFVVSDGNRTMTYEFDDNGTVAAGNFRVDILATNTAAQVAAAIQVALVNSQQNINPILLGNGLIYLGLSPNGSASVGTSPLTLVGVAQTPADGETFTISEGATTKTFEFTSDGTVGVTNIPILVSSNEFQDPVGPRLAAAIAGAGLSLNPTYVGNNVAVGGTGNHSIDTTGTPSLALVGNPGVESKTKLQVFGDLHLNVRGAFTDGQTFSLTNNGVKVVFEFDRNAGLPSQPDNVLIRISPQDTQQQIAGLIGTAIQGTHLG